MKRSNLQCSSRDSARRLRADPGGSLRRTAVWRWLAACLAATAVTGWGEAKESLEWSVRVWPISGFVDQEITSLAQADDGFIWVTTRQHLQRFDGAGFIEIALDSLGVEPGMRLRTMRRARDGSLWLGDTEGRLHRIARSGARTYQAAATSALIDKILEDRTGGIWITYRDGRVARLEGDAARLLDEPDGVPGFNSVLSLDRHGQIWFARRGHVGVIREGRLVTLVQLRGVTQIAPAAAGGLWIFGDTILYRLGENGQLDEVAQCPTGNATALLESREGAVWIGSVDAGLFRYFEGKVTPVPTSIAEVTCLLESLEGGIWVGTRGAGVNQIRPRAIAVEGAVAGLAAEAVRALCEDSEGRLWAAAQGGEVLVREAAGWAPAPMALRAAGPATSLAADRQEGIWIGTRARLLHRWRHGALETWTAADGVRSRRMNTLLASRTGRLWIGGSYPDAVQCLIAGELRDVALPRPGLNVGALAEDVHGTIWLGTYEGILLRTEGERLVEVPMPDPVPADRTVSIHSLRATPDGSVWVAYHGGGLGWIKDGRFLRLTTAHGLADDGVSVAIEDGRGWLWLGSGRGVTMLRDSELAALAAGHRAQVQPVRPGVEEGLSTLLIHSRGSGGALRTRDDRLWLPLGNSLVVANPAAVATDLPPAPVVLTEVRIDEQPRAAYGGPLPLAAELLPLDSSATGGRPLRFGPVARKVEFYFASLSFVGPANVRYRYRLANFDRAWSEPSPQRTAVYPRLSPGDYRFEVEGTNSAGEWSGTVAAVSFAIAPFFWETWPLRAALLVSFAASIFWIARGISHRRLRHKLRATQHEAAVARERTRIARDIHDDIGNRLTGILLLAGLAQRDRAQPEKAAEHLRHISSSAVEMTDALDEIVWAVNPHNDTLSHLVGYVTKSAVELLRTAGIKCQIEMPAAVPDGAVAAEVRHNFFLVTKEAVTNVVRHAGATEARFAIALEGDRLVMHLSDNGRGLPTEPDPSSNGLRNMRARMEEIGGELRIESRPGRGLSLSFRFPWGSET